VRRPRSTFLNRRHRGLGVALLAVLAALAISFRATRADAQACCAGAAAVTPGRLAIHEDALAGVQARAADMFGSFKPDGTYVRASATEWDFEQDLFGAVRVARRAQVALLLPVIETYRRERGLGGDVSDFGGGVGDVNLSGRYDFVLAGESGVVPGIAALVGFTLPTGRAPDAGDAAAHPLVADATGIGAWQVNLGLALEQTAGPWLFGVTGLYARRSLRKIGDVSTSLGAQWTVLASAAYTLPSDAALAFVVSYAVEGNAEIEGAQIPMTQRRIPQLTLAGVYPFNDRLRLQGGTFAMPPVSHLGQNTPASWGMIAALVRSWS
jgi:hypothetical protein